MSCPDPVRQQGPLSHLDYGFNWGPYLPPGAVVTGSVWAADPAPLVAPLVFDGESHVGGVAMIWITGGVVGTDYLVTNTIAFLVGEVERTDSRSFILKVREVLA